jgi:predicted ester cyclase
VTITAPIQETTMSLSTSPNDTSTNDTSTYDTSADDTPTDDTVTNAGIFRVWVERFNARDFERIAEIIDADVVDHHLPPGLPSGRAGAMQWFHVLADALDLRLTVEDTVEAGDRVAVRASITGTHVGEFSGVPATGRSFTTTMISIERFADGRIVERWENVDNLAVVQQLTAPD